MPLLQPSLLSKFVSRIFEAAGAAPETARRVAESLVGSDLAGHDSHGVVRVRQYLDSIAAGEVDPRAEPTISHEAGVVTMVDGRSGFGQLTAAFGMGLTVAKARHHGLAATGLQNCTHVGRLGEWVEQAAVAGQIGLAYCNGSRPGGIVTPYGGAGRALGTNPVAAAIPVAGGPPLVIDFATSAVAEGKLRVARNRGKVIPEGLILDPAGRPSSDPNDFYAGGVLLPAAGHKGYGLSLLVEFLGGLLTGTGCPGLPGYSRLLNGVLFIVLAPGAFGPADTFLEEGAALCARVKAVPPAEGFAEVLLPGDPERLVAELRWREGIPVDEATWNLLTDAAVDLGIAPPEL